MDDIVEPASTQYNDWKGTIALDVQEDHDIEELLGIDARRRSVVALSLYQEEATHIITAYATEVSDSDADARRNAWEEAGQVDMTAINIETNAVNAWEFLARAFRRIDIKASTIPKCQLSVPLHIADEVYASDL